MTSNELIFTFKPLTPQTWSDLETLFGDHGAYGGCWCMWWRSKRKEFEQRGSKGNKAALKAIVDSGLPTGILAYQKKSPIGWCSIAPRHTYGSLERSPILKRIDDQPVWSLVCLFVAKQSRRQGVAEALVRAALDRAAQQGARIVEAYPTLSNKKELPPVSSFMGVPELFLRVGFQEVARPSKSRMILRYFV